MDHRLAIDPYVGWSDDWAQTPDGHYYSNKAPGPALVAYPFMLVHDRLFPPADPRKPYSLTVKVLLCILLQILPFAWFSALALNLLAERGVSRAGQTFAALALFFGNTADPFMMVYFGHGLAAWLLVACLVAFARRRFFWVGMTFGWALLSEFSVALLLLPLALSLLELMGRRDRLRATGLVVLGGLLPGLLWAWYHQSCFGGVLTIAQQFQNPRFVEKTVSPRGSLGAVIGLWPSPAILWEVLFGARRGLLFTQPWVLLVAPLLALWRPRSVPRALGIFATVGLVEFIWMNASFSGWHGGDTAGPRYLGVILPPVALAAGFFHDRAPRWLRGIGWALLGVAVSLNALIFAWSSLIPEREPAMWPYFWRWAWHSTRTEGRLAFFTVAVLVAVGVTAWRARGTSRSIGTSADRAA